MILIIYNFKTLESLFSKYVCIKTLINPRHTFTARGRDGIHEAWLTNIFEHADTSTQSLYCCLGVCPSVILCLLQVFCHHTQRVNSGIYQQVQLYTGLILQPSQLANMTGLRMHVGVSRASSARVPLVVFFISSYLHSSRDSP